MIPEVAAAGVVELQVHAVVYPGKGTGGGNAGEQVEGLDSRVHAAALSAVQACPTAQVLKSLVSSWSMNSPQAMLRRMPYQ